MMCPINLKKITTTTKIGRNIYFKNTRVDECTNEIMKLEAYCKQGPFFNRNRSHFWDGRMGQFYNKKKHQYIICSASSTGKCGNY